MIRPTNFNADNSVDVWHDEFNHGGNATIANVRFGTNPDGSPDWRQLFISCPVPGCASETQHWPLGDGLARRLIQRLYLRCVLARAAALGLPVGQRSFASIKARLKQWVQDLDGDLGRWEIEDVASA